MKTQVQRNNEANARTGGQISTREQRRAEHMANAAAAAARRDLRPRTVKRSANKVESGK